MENIPDISGRIIVCLPERKLLLNNSQQFNSRLLTCESRCERKVVTSSLHRIRMSQAGSMNRALKLLTYIYKPVSRGILSARELENGKLTWALGG